MHLADLGDFLPLIILILISAWANHAKKKKEEAVPAVGWTGAVGLGFISLSGNASTLTVSGNAAAGMRVQSPALRSSAITSFAVHDLREPPPGEFELIFCRNVLIYFKRDAAREVLAHAVGHERQFRRIQRGQIGEAGGSQRVPGDVRDDAAQIANPAAGVQQPGLFLAQRAVAK